MAIAFPIRGLIELAERHPMEPKWLVVPTQQDGAVLTLAAARAGTGLLDLEPLTLRLLAEKIGKASLEAEGKRPLPPGFDRLIVEQMLGADDGALRPLDPHHTRKDNPAIGDALCRSIQTLRMAATNAEHALQKARGRRARAVASALAAFERLLHDGGYFDEADLYHRATQQAVESNAVVAVLDEVQLDELPARLLEALRNHVPAFYRIGLPCSLSGNDVVDENIGLTVPVGTAGHRFADAKFLPKETTVHAAGSLYTEQPSDADALHLMAAATPADEVRAVLDHIRANRIPLEEVEVAYVRRDPYLALFLGLREDQTSADTPNRLVLPVSMASGRPLVSTGPGSFLKGLLGWIAEDFPPDRLLRLARGGLLRIDRIADLSRDTAVDGLGRIYFSRGLAGHRKAIERLDDAHPLRRALGALFDLLPSTPALPHQLAASCRAIAEQFGPVDVVGLRLKQTRSTPEAQPFTDDEFAYLQLVRHLDAMSEASPDLEFPLSRAATLLSKALLGGFGRAEAPKPGHLHVVPLENACFSGRMHLFVVGLHADALSASPITEAFVTQQADGDDESAADRAALGGSALPSGHPADLNLWLAVRALARASESVALSHPVLDPVTDDPLEPSPLFLRARWRAKDDLKQEIPVFHIAHDTNRLASAGAIDGAEYAVALGRAAAEPHPNEAARRLLAEQFPGAAQGLGSQQLKDNPEILTEHDGWIGELGTIHHGDLEDLNLFGEDALSATRLQTLASCPHKYFLRYVLGLKPAEEPPDEDDWLDALQRGDVLHQIFRRFMESLPPGQRPTAADEDMLRRVFEEVLAEREATYPPPDSAVGRKTRNRLWEATGIFFQTELAQKGCEPVAFELGFGNEPERRHEHPPGYPEDHTGPLTLDLPGLPPIRVKGYVDRVDRALDGEDAGRYAVWDYKTGSSKKYVDKSDPLDEGRLIQPHLYAHALREAFGWDVAKTGFSFPTVKENGYREEYPVASAERLAEVIGDLSIFPPSGFFVQAPNAENCTYCDYREACGPYAERKKVIEPAATAAREDAEHPASDVLEKWNYL